MDEHTHSVSIGLIQRERARPGPVRHTATSAHRLNACECMRILFFSQSLKIQHLSRECACVLMTAHSLLLLVNSRPIRPPVPQPLAQIQQPVPHADGRVRQAEYCNYSTHALPPIFASVPPHAFPAPALPFVPVRSTSIDRTAVLREQTTTPPPSASAASALRHSLPTRLIFFSPKLSGLICMPLHLIPPSRSSRRMLRS